MQLSMRGAGLAVMSGVAFCATLLSGASPLSAQVVAPWMPSGAGPQFVAPLRTATPSAGLRDVFARYTADLARAPIRAPKPVLLAQSMLAQATTSTGSSSSTTKSAAASPAARAVTIVLTGDTGFSRNHSRVHKDGVLKYGKRQRWTSATSGIAKDIDGDLNFTNIETVVTTDNTIARDKKGQKGPFNFRSHPNAIRHLVSRGFNLFSLANNHTMDYGPRGLRDTLKHVTAVRGQGLLAATGAGMNRDEASRPEVVEAGGARVAFASLGIATNNLTRHRAGPNKPGQLAYRFDEDFALATKRLSEAPADMRMLSIHYGYEGKVRTDSKQIKEWRRDAVMKQGIDLVVGHHAHVVRGVEHVGDRVIFYGLGNFLHHGTADMRAKGICKDYGLLAKVHALADESGRLRIRAVEAVPVTNTHIRTTRFTSVKKSHQRIHALNYLASLLDSKQDGARGMRFTPQRDGSGLFCMPGAAAVGGKIGALCKSWTPAPPVPINLRARIAGSCRR